MIKILHATSPSLANRMFSLAALLLASAPVSAHAQASLFLSSTGAQLGQSSDICVSMSGGGGEVAGLQANLRWDDTCMTPTDARRLCRVNPATGKNVQTALQGRGALKAILISFSDVNPIPDGQLFCCSFTAVGAEGARCPAVQLEQIIGSTSTGTRINNIRAGNTGVFAVLAPGQTDGGAVAGGSGPDAGAGQAPAPVGEFAPPGAVAGGATGGGDAGAPSGAGGPLGGRADAGVPGLPAQPRNVPPAEVPPLPDARVREPAEIVEVPQAELPPGGEPAGALQDLGAAVTATAGTTTPEMATATQAPQTPATPTPQPNTPTPIPATNTPTPDEGWLGGCEMRIPG